MKNPPVFIIGSHKSGTSLLRSLLDGHPELYVIPFETHFMASLGRWVQYSYRRQTPHENFEFSEKFLETLKKYSNSKDNLLNVRPTKSTTSNFFFNSFCWQISIWSLYLKFRSLIVDMI